ncbi:hypothetical protein JN11_04912 [Mucilaginibacter frigoritolerans]|uniref:Uncharacterized protein n=1 Tax=Mucilaginibacter frigoritolerans TaxID=652788 RepID=A0A562TKA7_9SPHI|nr:hypothetical protein [Mucilaginibacter frigoritolerans]TWI93902.1 hypothetical protein JN11_04912 [Mucilaginibacter frigoritolerans]
MKKVYLFVFIGIIAIVMVVVELVNIDPKDESWGFTILGACIAIVIIKSPSIFRWFKNKINTK